MPTTQKTRTKTELTLQQSTLLVQNCAKSFVSMITYLRDIFPAESYESKSYAGAKFRSLKNISEEGEDGSSNKLLRFLEGDVYEMIEAGHLEHLMLAIYQKNTGELLEQYLLKISTATESKPFAIEISKKLNASDKRKSKFQLEKANIGTFLFCSLFTIFPLLFSYLTSTITRSPSLSPLLHYPQRLTFAKLYVEYKQCLRRSSLSLRMLTSSS